MKTFDIELSRWIPEGEEFIEIDSPKVHNTIGLDHTKWLLAQDRTKCQIVVERKQEICRLVVEFYDENTLAQYHLMWAK